MRTIPILTRFLTASSVMLFGLSASASNQLSIPVGQALHAHLSHARGARNNRVTANSCKSSGETIRLTLERAGDEKRKGSCINELAFLRKALAIYETNHSAPTEQSYYQFKGIGKEFARCGRKEEGTEFLWRLVQRKMVDGFPDFEFPESRDLPEWQADNKGLASGETALGGLLEMPDYQISQHAPLGQEAVLFRLLDCARETRNAGNMLYALAKLKKFYQDLPIYSTNRLSKLSDICEQMEVWREFENNPSKRILGLLDSADALSKNNDIQKSIEKLRTAASVKRTLKSAEDLNGPEFTIRLTSLQNDFLSKDRHQEATALLREIGSGTVVTF